MRLITRCPACATLFKVVPDQLRISEGWVRCGHCAEVFDATAHFHDPDAPVPAPPADVPGAEPQAREAEPATANDDASADPVAQPVDEPEMPLVEPAAESAHAEDAYAPEPMAERSADVASYGPTTSLPPELPASMDLPTDAVSTYVPPFEPMAESAQPHDLPAAATERAFDAAPLAVTDASEAASQSEPLVPADAEAPLAGGSHDHADSPSPPEPEPEPEPAVTPAFVRQADRRAFWRRPAVRAALIAFVGMALLGLAAQIIRMERDRIAAYVPAARPALEQACALLDCEVGALRRIEAVAVDGSSFTRLRADTYRLGLVLRNTGGVDIAMPSVELTLTNLQGQTVLRRVLSPADMGAARTLSAASEWVGDLPVVLDGGDVASRVAGYTVLPFYP